MEWIGRNRATTEYRCAAGATSVAKGISDDKVLDFASNENRILLTSNARDFGPLAVEWFLMGRDHAGIIIVPGRTDRALLSRALQALSGKSLPEAFINTYRFIQELLD